MGAQSMTRTQSIMCAQSIARGHFETISVSVQKNKIFEILFLQNMYKSGSSAADT
jgi:hypothetical protein